MAKNNLPDLVEEFMDQEGIYTLEGYQGIRSFEKIVKVLGYDSLNEFLEDNSSAIETLIEWIGNERNPDWIHAMKERVSLVGEEIEDDEE